MLRLVLRPLLVILTLGALLTALFQVAGRITFIFLDDLELAVNQFLSPQGIRVRGLSGDWHMLDPIIRIDRVDFPAGYLEDVVLEVDAVETAVRGTLLANRLQVADAEVVLEKRPGQPWRLRGARQDTAFDPLPALRHSDQLELSGRVVFERDDMPAARVGFAYLGLNRGGEHRHRLTLDNAPDDCAGACSLQVDLHTRDRLWPLEPGRARVTASSAGFLLPRQILGISPLQIAELDLYWQQVDDDSGGSLKLRSEQFDMPGDVTLAMSLAGSVRGRGGVHSGSVLDWQVEQGDDTWTLPELAVDAEAGSVSVWMSRLDLARASAFLSQALAAVGPAQRWLEALDVRGVAHNLRASYGGDGSGLSYAMTIDQVGFDGYKGVPTVRNAGGELFGHERGFQLNLNAQAVEMAFPDVFTDRWALPYAQGVLQAWFKPDYFGVRGLNLRAETDGSRAAGSFAMSRPPDREGQRLLLLVSSDRIPVAQAQRFVPYRLPEGLKQWLLTAPRAGVLEDALLAYQGQFQQDPGEVARRLELVGRVRGGELLYHPDWPLVSGLDGEVTVAGSSVDVAVAQAESAGARIAGSEVRVLDNASAVSVSLDADTEAAAVLDFLRTTPLSFWVSFLEPDWQATGPMRLSGELTVPLGESTEEPAVRLRGDLDRVALRMPGYRVALDGLEGSIRYRYPYQVDAVGVTGRMFDAPVTLSASTIDDRVHFRFDGRASTDDVWRLIDIDDPGLAAGSFDFAADVGIAVAPDQVTEIEVDSSLEGVALDLPAGYAKAPAEATPAHATISLLAEHNTARFNYRDARGWLDFADQPLRGAITFGSLAEAPAAPAAAEVSATAAAVPGDLVLRGQLAGFDLAAVVGEGGAGLPLPVRLDGLRVGEIAVGEFAVTDAILDGLLAADTLSLVVSSTELSGAISARGDEPLQVSLGRVSLPAGEETDEDAPAVDPLQPDLIADLPAADVDIEQLLLGPEDFGSWRFQLRPADGNLAVRDLQATVRGVVVASAEDLLWRADRNETHFVGDVSAGNLAEVLPLWDYAASVETGSASLSGDFTWSGSPLMVDLLALRGQAQIEAEDGRFVDVESGAGAQKIFSLLNFTAIAKRLSLNFSDVFGRGVSFDEMSAEFSLDEGLLTFLEPLRVGGTGSQFRVTGTVDLRAGRLDNEMIVTLPVSKSLPWYAAYLALANPLAGAAVIVGERVLRKPLEQFSSARYRIGGTLDEPDVRFVSVFDVTPGSGRAEVAERGERQDETQQAEAANEPGDQQEPDPEMPLQPRTQPTPPPSSPRS